MIIKTKKVYYCEHCGRHRLTAHSIKQHEGGCTANPNRSCGVCGGQDMEALLAKYKGCFVINEHEWLSSEWIGEPRTLDELRTDTEGCPVCILAVIRQCNLNRSPGDFMEFNYQKEHKEYWAERNAEYEYEMSYCQ